MKALVVAPDSNLAGGQAETQNIINTINARALIGKVTVGSLFDHLSDNQYDYIHVIAHGSTDGVCLSDKCVSASAFAQIIAIAKPSVVYLNSCNSINTATIMRDMLANAAIVTTITEIEDEEAYISGSIFAKAMIEFSGNAELSYEKSRRKHSANYVLLKSTKQVAEYPLMIEGGQLLDAVMDLGSKIERYDQRMLYVTSTFVNTADQINQINRKIDTLAVDSHKDVPISWIIGYFVFVISLFLLIDSYDLFAIFSAWQKTASAIVLQIVAFGFFMYGLGWIEIKGLR